MGDSRRAAPRLVPIEDLERLLPEGASARLYSASGRPLPILVRRAPEGWLAEAPLGELREWCREGGCPERLTALRCEAIIVAARGPGYGGRQLWSGGLAALAPKSFPPNQVFFGPRAIPQLSPRLHRHGGRFVEMR